MLALAAPLIDSTNRDMSEEAGETPSAPLCFLSLLAEASLERLHHDAKRPKNSWPGPTSLASLECGEALGGEGAGIIPALETAARPRCPSRHSASSGSTSPSSGPGSGGGKSYLCNQCGREYASTDAVRKHARQNHAEWLKEQGQGCPSLYCTVVEATGTGTGTGTGTADGSATFATSAAVASAKMAMATPPAPTFAMPVGAPVAAAPVAPPPVVTAAVVTATPAVAVKASAAPHPALSVTTPSAATLPAAAPSPADPSAARLLMTAAESCLALSMAAHADSDEEDAQESDAAYYSYRADQLAAFMRAPERWGAPAARGPAARGGAGNKRPRSVRCGKCDGCERDDCGMCKNCVDKPKFGGIGQRKQGCVRKICRQPRVAV